MKLFGALLPCVLVLLASSLTGCASASKKGPAPAADASKPTELWTARESIDTPESAHWDAATKTIYVSNVAGSPGEKDGRGWISKLDSQGKLIQGQWVHGLNAPKGIAIHNGTLWVSDLDEMVSIDVASGKIKRKIKIKGAKFLNDVAIDSRGDVYVSDTMGGGAIYLIHNGKVKTFAKGPETESPNGLFILGDKLIVAGWGKNAKPDFSTEAPGHLFKMDLKTKKKQLIMAQPLGNLDGIEMDPDGNYLVTDWMAGKVFLVNPDGKSRVLLEGFKGSADIGLIPETRTLIIPVMMENRVTAYSLQGVK